MAIRLRKIKNSRTTKLKIMKREQGYYWVKHKGNWTIAKWNLSPFGDVWYVWNWIGDLNDFEFEEIDERQITRSDEQST